MQIRPIEVACDESGFSGTNLLDPYGEVFAHAAVRLTRESAERCVERVRAGSPYSFGEYKSRRLLQAAQRPLLEWLLGPAGPLCGCARVHLTDKQYFVAARVIDVLVREPSYAARTSLDRDPRARSMALTLYRDGATAFGPDRWHAFLQAFVVLMRAKRGRRRPPSVGTFVAALNDLAWPRPTGLLGEVVESLSRSRHRLDALVTRLLDDPAMLPPLEQLMPALVEAGLHWSGDGSPVAIVHDEQSALTPRRVAEIRKVVSGTRLRSVRKVDSRTDPRVQVADLLAGAARRIATAELRGRGDPGLTALLRPYLDPHSIWADDASWSRLAMPPALRGGASAASGGGSSVC